MYVYKFKNSAFHSVLKQALQPVKQIKQQLEKMALRRNPSLSFKMSFQWGFCCNPPYRRR